MFIFGGFMKAAFYTLGCKVNQYETQLMEQQLISAGYEIVPHTASADVYIINSCTVTAESDRKTRQILRRLKQQNPESLAVLAGCFPQSSSQKAQSIPEADIIAGTRERADICSLIDKALKSGKRVVSVAPFSEKEVYTPMRAESFYGHTRAFVKIEDGCESYCSYCIIPYARGPVRSKPPEEIKKEVSGLAKKGYKEVVLVGINLTSYGKDCGAGLADALRAACESGIDRVRLGSLEPNIITPEFISCVKSLENVCPQFHLALQSGCGATLRRMNRHYTPEQYRHAVEELRKVLPDCAVTTDIITGFPGETEEEFEQSLAFASEIGFAKAHVFPYSKRAGTRAAAMDGQIDNKEKSRRCRVMIDACSVSRREFLLSHTGKTYPVLFETGKNSIYEGFTRDYAPVKVVSDKNLQGEIIDVYINGCDGDICTGVIKS
jgi:threonylcarbamoyladenosine tRNA methylthiotransferase MtaB